jgi:integrase
VTDSTTKRTRRSNGEGAVYLTADGRLRGAVTVTNPATGEVERRYVSGSSRAEVVRLMDDARKDANAGNFGTETTGEYLARWIDTAASQLRPATVRGYRQHITGHLAPLAAVPLARLTPGHVERAMATMIGRGLAPQTAQHARSTLRRALRDAQRDALVSRNVASLARPPRMERRELHPLTAVQVRELLTATAGDPAAEPPVPRDRFRPLYALAVATGLRQGELLGLRWTDVDLAARLLVVRRAMARTADGGYALAEPKTSHSRRTVMLSALALEALTERQADQDADRAAAGSAWQDREGLVFTDTIGRPVNPPAVSAAFRKAADARGFTVRFHDLRHTAATLLLGAGVPLKVVSETLGHSNIAITADVYAHVTPELRREAADAMDRALAGES